METHGKAMHLLGFPLSLHVPSLPCPRRRVPVKRTPIACHHYLRSPLSPQPCPTASMLCSSHHVIGVPWDNQGTICPANDLKERPSIRL